MELVRQMKRLREDNTSGSSAILQELIENLLRHSEDLQKDFVAAEEELSRAQDRFREFAVLRHFIGGFLRAGSADAAIAFTAGYRQRWRDVNEKLAAVFLREVDLANKTILLHSHSGSIVQLFKTCVERPRIIQTESRPALEGVKQAEALAKMGYRTTLVTDMAFSRYMDKVDLALLGADAIFKDAFVNKIGSRSIALAARECDKPVYVLADSRKFLNEEGALAERPKPPAEILAAPPGNVYPENYYFELTPLKYVAWVTENGIYGGP